jgi:REP element-mobilizing transposase RayT
MDSRSAHGSGRYDPARHHRRSVRPPGFDYAAAGSYFLTICTVDRAFLFGEVDRGRMELNDYGRIVLEEWHRSLEIRPTIALDAVVVMPNHLHGITTFDADETRIDSVGPELRRPRNRAHRRAPLQRRPRSIGSFVAGFKAASTKRINSLRDLPGTPVWQRNYYDHIIRDDDAYARIYNYILTNPVRWELDRENPNRWGADDFDGWLDLDEPTPDRRHPPL